MRIGRLFVIDENLPKRLATELKGRGFQARTMAQLNLKGINDSIIIERLSLGIDEDWVLLTGDDKLPLVHAEAVKRFTPTIATVDPRRPPHLDHDQHRKNVAHRWAHVIVVQEPSTIRRYSTTWSKPWRPLRR